jgi:hypothetical protein
MKKFNQMSKDLNRSSDNYKQLSEQVKSEYERRITNGNKRPNWTSSGKTKGIIATLRIQNPELMEHVFPTDKDWTNEGIKKEMKNMMNPNAESLVSKEDRRKTRHAEEANTKKNLHMDNKRQENEIARLKRVNNDLQRQLVDENEEHEVLLGKYQEITQERDELLLESNKPNDQQVILDYNFDQMQKTSHRIVIQNYAMMVGVLLWTGYTSNYQIVNSFRYLLENTLDMLPQ